MSEFSTFHEYAAAVVNAYDGGVDPRLKMKDQDCPPELEGLAVGQTVRVSIQGDAHRAVGAVGRMVDRPLFGFPRRSFVIASVAIKGPYNVTGELQFIHDDDGGFVMSFPNSAGEMIPVTLALGTDPCQDLLFVPLED